MVSKRVLARDGLAKTAKAGNEAYAGCQDFGTKYRSGRLSGSFPQLQCCRGWWYDTLPRSQRADRRPHQSCPHVAKLEYIASCLSFIDDARTRVSPWLL